MSYFNKKQDDNKPVEMNSYTAPANGGGYTYSGVNQDQLGNVPRLNDQQNAYGQYNVNAQQQYDQQFQIKINTGQYTNQDPLMSDPANRSDNVTYNTVIDDNQIQQQQSPSQLNVCIEQIKQMMRMEGKSPICKLLTYINIFLGVLIFYLIIRSF